MVIFCTTVLHLRISMSFVFFRACLIATVRSSGASQSTIKLVATNLIASGKLAGTRSYFCSSFLTTLELETFADRNFRRFFTLSAKVSTSKVTFFFLGSNIATFFLQSFDFFLRLLVYLNFFLFFRGC